MEGVSSRMSLRAKDMMASRGDADEARGVDAAPSTTMTTAAGDTLNSIADEASAASFAGPAVDEDEVRGAREGGGRVVEVLPKLRGDA